MEIRVSIISYGEIRFDVQAHFRNKGQGQF